jgi:hypothetical protein
MDSCGLLLLLMSSPKKWIEALNLRDGRQLTSLSHVLSSKVVDQVVDSIVGYLGLAHESLEIDASPSEALNGGKCLLIANELLLLLLLLLKHLAHQGLLFRIRNVLLHDQLHILVESLLLLLLLIL